MARITSDLANDLAQIVSDIFSDGLLQILDGTPGANPVAIPIGSNLLCEVLIPAVGFNPPVDGALTLTGQWFGTVYRPGVASWARFLDRAGDTAMIVTVSGPAGLAELKISNLNLEEGAVVSITDFLYQVPMT